VTGAVISKYNQPPNQVQVAQLPKKGSCDEDTYAKCVKVRFTPSSPTLPPKPTPLVQTTHANPFSPLSIEPSLLEMYVCPLFANSDDQLDNTSPNGVEPKTSPNVSPRKNNDKSTKDKTPLWQTNQSNILRSTALGAGLKKQKKLKTKLPCMDSYVNVQPSVNVNNPSIIQINHIQFNPNTNTLENPVQPIAQDTPRVDEPRIKLQFTCEEDVVFVNLHVYEGLGHRLLQSDGTNIVVPPKGPFCQKNGKIRKSYRLPHFSNRHNWSLRDTYLEDIFNKAQEYDSANGHIFPESNEWVDAFAEPNGSNAKFRNIGHHLTMHLSKTGVIAMYMLSLL
jgi:hypothetical protein